MAVRPRDGPIGAILREPAERGARRIALTHLAKAREARDRLDDPGNASSLHDFRVSLRHLRSWLRAFRPVLRDTVSAKVERRLERIATATGASRDLEVHIDWVVRARRTLTDRGRGGAAWLLRRLRASKREADAELRAAIDRDFERATLRAEEGLQRYEARVADDGPRFGDVAADLIVRHAVELEQAMSRVSTQGDRAEAHAARIAAKRLRYLAEGVADAAPEAQALVDELKRLQDTLGELHDAQLFGSELSTRIAELLADRTAAGKPSTGPNANGRPDPVNGLRVLLRRLRRAEATSFASFQATWGGGVAVAAFTERVGVIERCLREGATRVDAVDTLPARRRGRPRQ